jgi:hypothetical protein
LAPIRSDIDQVSSPVARIAPTWGYARSLEFVQQYHQVVRVDAQHAAVLIGRKKVFLSHFDRI